MQLKTSYITWLVTKLDGMVPIHLWDLEILIKKKNLIINIMQSIIEKFNLKSFREWVDNHALNTFKYSMWILIGIDVLRIFIEIV